jgi:hypothetical protein
MQLTGPGATPFHVLAKIRYTVGSASFDGDYELLWASADRYREAFRLGPLLSVYVATQNKLHIQRNSPTLTYMQWRVRELMNLPEAKSVDSKIDIGKVFKSQRGSQDAVCATLNSSGKGFAECFAAATGEIVSSEGKRTDGKTQIGLNEDGFTNVGTERYPSHIVSTIGDESIDIQVEKFEIANHFDDATFVPPDGASSLDWCAQPEVKNLEEDPTIFSFSVISGSYLGDVPANSRIANVYLKAAPDGHVEKLAELSRDGSAKDITDRHLREKRFPIHICAGTPIGYEEVFQAAIPAGLDQGPTQLERSSATARPGR